MPTIFRYGIRRSSSVVLSISRKNAKAAQNLKATFCNVDGLKFSFFDFYKGPEGLPIPLGNCVSRFKYLSIVSWNVIPFRLKVKLKMFSDSSESDTISNLRTLLYPCSYRNPLITSYVKISLSSYVRELRLTS